MKHLGEKTLQQNAANFEMSTFKDRFKLYISTHPFNAKYDLSLLIHE